MAYTYRILTLNINGLASKNRHKMLEQFMRRHEADIVMLQEVTSKQHIVVKDYHIIDNIGTVGRGTAIITRKDLQMDGIKGIPWSKGLTAYYKNPCFINIYAPSGTNKRTEREAFFNQDVIDLLPQNPTEIIMAGDLASRQTTIVPDIATVVKHLKSWPEGCIWRMYGIRRSMPTPIHTIHQRAQLD